MIERNSLEVRDIEIEGCRPWMWPKGDQWAWDQPLEEWPALRNLISDSCVAGRRTIVQAGGCCGMYPRLWANHFDTVYTFEPDALNFYCLVTNTAPVSERVFAMRAALGAVAGVCNVVGKREYNAGLGRVVPFEGATPIVRLDDFHFDNLDAMQLDCEGYEDQVIEGARKTIETHWPVISVENPSSNLTDDLQATGYTIAGVVTSTRDVVDVVFVPK